MELISSLGFVKIKKADEGDSKDQIIKNLKEGFSNMKKIDEGKIKSTTAEDFLDE